MKAIKHIEYGPPERLELTDLPRPSPGESEILIEVRAATVNRTDCAMMRAKPWIMRFVTGLWRPKKPVLGTDVAGTVVAAGAEVREFAVGDRVFGFNDVGLGSHAEYAVVSAGDALATIPDGVSFEQAAASLEGAHYAINFINKVSIARGQEILVNGATGAIGSAAVQLLVAMDVRVTAVCGTAGVASVTALGVERVIDYQKEDFTQLDTRFDHVFDCVGKSTFGRCKPLLKPKGVYISSELGPMAQNPWLALFTPIFGGRRVKFPVPKDRKQSVLTMQKHLREGTFRPLIDKIVGLDDLVEAFRFVETGEKMGNVVMAIGPAD